MNHFLLTKNLKLSRLCNIELTEKRLILVDFQNKSDKLNLRINLLQSNYNKNIAAVNFNLFNREEYLIYSNKLLLELKLEKSILDDLNFKIEQIKLEIINDERKLKLIEEKKIESLNEFYCYIQELERN